LLAAPSAAHATEGWYGKIDAGYSINGDGASAIDFTPPTPTGVVPAGTIQLNNSKDLQKDWMGDVGLGYAFTNGFRLEGEIGGRFNEIDKDATTGGDDIHAWSGMLNGLYDFNRDGVIQPYVGVGVGAARLLTKAYTPAVNQSVNDEDTVFAYQGLVGVGFKATEQLVLDLGYRYFIAEGADFKGTSTSPAVPAGSSWAGDYKHQAITLGIRYQFAGPPAPLPPPPPPPPPPEAAPPPVQVCPVQEFKVYFDWDRSNLNTLANDTLAQNISRIKACNASSIKVVGYTDTSGSPKYNLVLSQKRAQVVVDALAAAGLPVAIISADAAGEAVLEKPTADGVREPLNRRSVVTVQFQ
jgi:outer membrane protein OmpA-like peptidoglycan-associated protein